MDAKTRDEMALPASYASSTFVSGTEGTRVTFYFDERDEAEAWHEALIRQHDADSANGAFDDGDYE